MQLKSVSKSISASFAILVLAAAGCVSPERKPAVSAVSSLADTRASLVAGKANIDDVNSSLAALESKPTDLTPAYNRYKDAVAAVERRADTVGERVRDMRERSAEYRASWAQENAQISDPTMRATGDQRRQRMIDKFDQIDTDAQQLRAAYDPFITKLRDLKTLLQNDLTYNGVAAAKPGFDGVRSSATALRMKVDALIAELDDASMRLSPSTAPLP